MLHRIIAISLTVLMLLTNVWVPVYSHICNGRGQAWHSILLPAKSCCSKSRTRNRCHPPASATTPVQQGLKKKACCENEIKFVLAASRCTAELSGWSLLTSQLSPLAALPQQAFQCPYLPVVAVPGFLSFWPHGPPAPLSGRWILIFKQVFRL